MAVAGNHSVKPIIGGILCIAAGVIGLTLAILTLAYADPATSETDSLSGGALVTWIILLSIIPSAIAIAGGYFALRRRNFWLAILGGVAGILTLPLLFIWLPIPAVILIWLSRKEFPQKQAKP